MDGEQTELEMLSLRSTEVSVVGVKPKEQSSKCGLRQQQVRRTTRLLSALLTAPQAALRAPT